ncbi:MULTISPECIES: heavy-metal-associated domain-containing protein [unclassified Moraxella]|uniref:heavy-metal-associated domain-containing protein n=1 Tax=unclassified Moraxella TaxID=2685852 RepID=UPI003AF64AA8
MQTIINIDGMTCGGCVKSVQTALSQLDGVQNVSVSLEQKNATIDYDDSKIDMDKLTQAIEDAGFDVVS